MTLEQLTKRRALIIEDEALVAMMLEDMLDELGYSVVGTAASLQQAVAATAQPLELALVDVNLAGEISFPAARLLRAQGTPFVFTTGYGASALEGTDFQVPVLQKPFGKDDLARAIQRVTRSGDTSP
jgi:CheY-like chemotaxis protein